MARMLRFLTVALVIALLAVMAWLVVHPHETEPVYQGRRLSEWLQGYSGISIGTNANPAQAQQEAMAAVRAEGTNALPLLLKMLRAHDSNLKLRLIALARKQHVVAIPFTPATNLNLQAGLAFGALGPAAKETVPALTEIYAQQISTTSLTATSEALGFIGPPASQAVPALLRGTTNAEYTVRANAIWALGQIHAEPELVVPALVKSLRDPYVVVRQQTLSALIAYGPAAKLAVPALIAALNNRDPLVTKIAEATLVQIDPEAAAKFLTASNHPGASGGK
jgi:HEAT repeat protein